MTFTCGIFVNQHVRCMLGIDPPREELRHAPLRDPHPRPVIPEPSQDLAAILARGDVPLQE